MCGDDLPVSLSNGGNIKKECAGKDFCCRHMNGCRRRELVALRSLGQFHEPILFTCVEGVSSTVRHIKVRAEGRAS